METHQTEAQRTARFAAYIEARKFDPPRPLLMAAAALVDGKQHALDVGAGALNATKYLLSLGFEHVTALDASLHAQKIAEELLHEKVTFVLSRFEYFKFLPEHYDLINAEFSLPFISSEHFASTFNKLLSAIKSGGIFTGQLFGPNDSWNVESSEMTFHTRAAVETYLRDFELLQFMEEDHPGTTKLGESKHWHIFHIIARKTPRQPARGR